MSNDKLRQCLEYCLDQIETSGGEILEGITADDIKAMMPARTYEATIRMAPGCEIYRRYEADNERQALTKCRHDIGYEGGLQIAKIEEVTK